MANAQAVVKSRSDRGHVGKSVDRRGSVGTGIAVPENKWVHPAVGLNYEVAC